MIGKSFLKMSMENSMRRMMKRAKDLEEHAEFLMGLDPAEFLKMSETLWKAGARYHVDVYGGEVTVFASRSLKMFAKSLETIQKDIETRGAKEIVENADFEIARKEARRKYGRAEDFYGEVDSDCNSTCSELDEIKDGFKEEWGVPLFSESEDDE